MRTNLGKLRAWWALAALVAGLLIGIWHPSGRYAATASFEGRLLDLRHLVRGPAVPPPDFAIVAIDDKTIDRLQRFPIPRQAIADAVDRLTDAGAKVVVVDLLLFEREAGSVGANLSAGDAALAQALKRNGRAILAAAASESAPSTGDSNEIINLNAFGVVTPLPGTQAPAQRRMGVRLPIAEFAQAARLALVNVAPDSDGGIRRVSLAIPAGDDAYLPAISLEAVRLLKDIQRGQVRLTPGETVAFGSSTIPLGAENTIALYHYGGQGTFPTYSMIDLIDGEAPAAALAGKAVFLGSTALGNVDTFLSPFSTKLPGVEALTTAAANIAVGDYLLRDRSSLRIDIVVAALLGLFAFIAANQRSLAMAGAATAALWVVAAIGAQGAFVGQHLWLDTTTYILTLLLVGLVTFTGRIVQQRRISGQLQRERDNLARYHSPLLTDWLAAEQQPAFNERAQSAAVMFVDVAGFTRRSEQMGPAATVEFLRDLHGRIERAALAHRGVIEQFMGDGAMIIFGLPEPAADDAARALAAAQQLFTDLGDWNLDLKSHGAEAVRLRVGLHYGPVVAALLGGERQGQITVAGDTVNVASRLQEMGKEHAAIIVASAEFVASVRAGGRDDLLAGLQRLTGQKVRGREETIDLWIRR
jgi:adenylate cyclase